MKDNEVNGNRIEIEFCKRKLQSPFILTSGPLCYSAEGMIKGYQAGAGAVVTKTIRLSPAVNPIGHIARFGQNSLINAEKWADIPFEQWCEVEIPRTVASGATVIASVGHTLKEAKAIVGEVEKAGSHMIELVSYREETLLPMLDFTKAHVSIPVICKLSGNWDDPIESAKKCIEHGADGICAIDSIGPVLKIDIRKARPVMFGNDGYGWLTGEAIRPIALRIVAEIAMRFPDYKNIYGSGGIMSAENALEYVMAGAMGTGICSAGILKGVEFIRQLNHQLIKMLDVLGYPDIQSAYRAALSNFPGTERIRHYDFHFEPYKADGSPKCIQCKRCEQVCCYDARKLDFPQMQVDSKRCRDCGMCVDICPTGALTAAWAEQSDRERKKAALSADFDREIRES